MESKRLAKSWLNISIVGEYCMVSTATVRRWIKCGELQAIRLPSGHYRITFADFRDFLEQHDMPIREELELYRMSRLEMKLLEVVKRSAGGIDLPELLEAVGIGPIIARKAIGNLLDEGKIQTRDNRYYPAQLGKTSG